MSPSLPNVPRTESPPVIALVIGDDAAAIAAPAFELAAAGVPTLTAADREGALALFEEHGAFDLVIVDGRPGGASGLELVTEIAARWPVTSRVLISGGDDARAALAAVRDGRVLRLLGRPPRPDEVAAAIAAALERADAHRRERDLTERLEFTRDSLAEMLGELDRRLSREVDSLRGVQDLAKRLAEVSSLSEVAQITVDAASAALDGRAVRLELPSEAGRVRAESERRRIPGTALDRVPLPGEGWPELYLEDAATLTERDRRVLDSLVASAALATKSQQRLDERDDAQHAIVYALARLSERRDNETGQHLVRVSRYSRLIAERLRAAGRYRDELTDRFIDEVVRSAPLHDIGKVGIPDHVLLKPGPLTDDEWEVMRRHTTIGGDTIQAVIDSTTHVGFLEIARDIARHHHERWDGGGYPQGLAGTRIPLSARIVAVADVYDALTTRRPYKEAWSNARAIALLQRERGKQFDPALIDAFVPCRAERDEVRLACPDAAGLELDRAA